MTIIPGPGRSKYPNKKMHRSLDDVLKDERLPAPRMIEVSFQEDDSVLVALAISINYNWYWVTYVPWLLIKDHVDGRGYICPPVCDEPREWGRCLRIEIPHHYVVV